LLEGYEAFFASVSGSLLSLEAPNARPSGKQNAAFAKHELHAQKFIQRLRTRGGAKTFFARGCGKPEAIRQISCSFAGGGWNGIAREQ
jgi:hypothetical protein